MTQYTHADLAGTFGRRPFTLGEGDEAISYAREFWDKASEAEIEALGFVEYVAPEPTFEQQKAAKASAVDAKVADVLTSGYTVPSQVSTALAGKVLQTRNLEDRTNWLTSQAAYSAAVANGDGATEGADFRTADNETITVGYAGGLNVLLAMAAWGKAAMANSWELKDAVEAAEDQAALDAIDIETGWPA